MASSLMTHNPKFNSALVTRAELARLPEPIPLGPNHRPIPHAELVRMLDAEVTRRGYTETGSSFALSQRGAAIFGVIDLESPARLSEDHGLSLGFRAANDKSMALRMVAGARVFVCDNLTLSGDMIALHRFHTPGLDLGFAIASGFDRILLHAQALDRHIDRMRETVLSDEQARALAYSVFAAHVVPLRLLAPVHALYFSATQTPDDEGRTLWALHNAFTNALRELGPIHRFRATIKLGRYFGMAERTQADLPLMLG